MMNSSDSLRESFINKLNKQDPNRYFCCFINKPKVTHINNEDEINEGHSTWCVNEVSNDIYNRRSRNSDVKTVRFDSSCD